jgi:hypothetical protein
LYEHNVAKLIDRDLGSPETATDTSTQVHEIPIYDMRYTLHGRALPADHIHFPHSTSI